MHVIDIDGRGAVEGLKGIRVLDFTWAGAGPLAMAMMRMMGAEVVKVESATRPDMARAMARLYGWSTENSLDRSPSFNDLGAEKLSITLDLRQPKAREIAQRLAARADVICDNMRPGKMETLGLGYAQVSKVNPRVVCCSISATGRLDPGNDLDIPGYAPVFWAEGGGGSVTGWPEGGPSYLRSPVDLNAGTMACVGILAALHARLKTGRGAFIDCSAIETVVAAVGDELMAASLGLPAGGVRGNERLPYAPNDAFPCKGKDQWVAISIHDNTQWLSMCEVLGATELATDSTLLSREGRWKRRNELYAPIAALTATWDALQLEQALQARGVPAAQSKSLRTLFGDEALNARGFWKLLKHPLMEDQQVGALAWNLMPPMPEPDRGGALLGEHNAQVLEEWLGIGPAEFEQLKAQNLFV